MSGHALRLFNCGLALRMRQANGAICARCQLEHPSWSTRYTTPRKRSVVRVGSAFGCSVFLLMPCWDGRGGAGEVLAAGSVPG